MGLIQQAAEQAGIATASVTHLPDLTEKVSVPRALHIKFPLGRTFGQAGRTDLQEKITVDLLEAVQNRKEDDEKIQKLPYRWRRD